MGWFDGSSEVGSTTSHRRSKSTSGSKHHHSSSHSPRASSIFGLGDPSSSKSHHDKPRGSSIFGLGERESSRHEREKPRGSSIFGMGDGKHNSSRSSFFGFGGRSSSSSYYKRSPRTGYLKRIYAKLRRLLRDLIYYMKKNPVKVFMLVIMPLITGGALTGLLAKFGLRLPPGLQKLFGGRGGGMGGGMDYERSTMKASGPLGAMGGLGGVASAMGGMGGIGGAMSLAKMFM